MSHTPGPWYIGDINTNPDDGVVGEVAICAKTDRTPQGFCSPAVALPFGDHSQGRVMALANARLIAAAPDLLAALKAIVNEIRAYQSPECDDEDAIGAPELKAADAAIAKAEGTAT